MSSKLFKKSTGFLDFFFTKQNFDFHKNATNLVSARICIKTLIKKNNYKKIFLPKYICNDVIKNIDIKYELYSIDENLNPIFNFKDLKSKEAILIVNYFGIMNFEKEYSKFKRKIIFDYSHSFFNKLKNANVVYSPRKFLSLPDGGLFYSIKKNNIKKNLKTNKNVSISHLFLKHQNQFKKAYKDFRLNENKSNLNKFLKMSEISLKIMKSIDHSKIIKIRKKNFLLFHKKLNSLNLLKINNNNKIVPMCYPLLLKKKIKKRLISKGIFIPTYWPEVLKRTQKDDFENFLTKNLICLPIDQRIDNSLIGKICNEVKKY